MLFRSARLEARPAAPGQPPVTLEGLRIRSEQRPQGGGELFTLSLAMDGDALAAGPFRLGPSGFRLELRNIDMDTYVALQERIQAVQAQGLAPEQAGARVGELVLAELPALLEHHPEFAISRLASETPMGPVRGNLRVAYTGDPDIPPGAGLALLMQLEVDSELELPRPLVRGLLTQRVRTQVATAAAQQGEELEPAELQRRTVAAVDAQLDLMAGEGWLEQDDGQYRARLRFRQGRLTINGSPAEQLMALLTHN